MASLLALPLFLAVVGAASIWWSPPMALLAFYVVASPVTFLAYAVDKSSARRGGRRTAERTLHGLALLCGWPGALLAQQLLRHKSTKQPFRMVFWCTVIVNVAAFVFLCSPQGRAWWPMR